MRLLLLALLALGCADDAPASDVAHRSLTVDHAFARPAPSGGTSALYLDLVNATFEADTLVAIRSDAAARVALHRTVDRGDGMTGMEPVGAVPVPAGATLELAPGGLHAMLMDLTADLAEGDSLDVTVELAVRGSLSMRVPIRLDGGR